VEFFITIFLTLYTPYYLHNALQYNSVKTGFYASISRISQVPFRLIFGYASDKIKIDENVKLIVFNSIALAGAGICMLGLGFVPDNYPILGVILLSLISMSTGSGSSGFFKGAVLYTRQFSQFVIGICQFIKCGILFLAPIEVAAFVTESSNKNQWRIIFMSTGILALIVNIMFCRFSQACAAVYTADGFFDDKSKKANKDSS
jgi:sugar phosphate permease